MKYHPFTALSRSGLLEHFARPPTLGSPPTTDVLRSVRPYAAEPADPNWFYYKPSRPKTPVANFNRECQQWRHSIPAEELGVEIHFDDKAGKIAGLLECQVHCANLSDPSVMRVPVRIGIEQADTYERAAKLIERRRNKPPRQFVPLAPES